MEHWARGCRGVTTWVEETDVLVVGAGPAGSAAATWAARSGLEVTLADAAAFPRDKSCGDGLTPRAMGELDRLGLGAWTRQHTVNDGLRAHGFGQVLELPWPGGSLPAYGSAVARTELDDQLRRTALTAGARALPPAKAVDVVRTGERVRGVVFAADGGRREVRCDRLVVADGVRSPLGRVLGRQWHRDTVYGVAARAYLDSGREDRWISSHLELRGPAGELLSGYGWIFPLGGGQVNLGVGTLATAKRPANVSLRPLLEYYAGQRREEWQLGRRRADADLGPAADGRRGQRGGRTQLGADRRCRGLRQPAERRGDRLRAGDRAAGRRPAGRPSRPGARLARAAPQPLRAVVLHRPPAGRADHRARAAGPARADRDAAPGC